MLIGIDASRASGERLTGTERYSRELIAALLALGHAHRYRLYVRERTGWADELRAANVEVAHIDRPRLWTHVGLARELAADPPEALFVPAHVLPASFARPGARRVRAVVTVHDLGYRRFPSAHPIAQRAYLDLGTRFSVAHADAVIVDSRATLRDVRDNYGVPEERLRVAYPGAPSVAEVDAGDVNRVLEKFGLRDRPFLLHVGTLQPRKNLRRLVQAWAALSRPPGACLALAGAPGWGGDLERVRADIAAFGLGDSVRLLGYVTDAEKAALLRSARAFVFPSLYEGFGLPVLEAHAAGLPVACSNTSSLPEVAGDAALLFDPLSADDIAAALIRLLHDDVLRDDLIARGHRNAARFSWDNCARVVLGAIEGRNE